MILVADCSALIALSVCESLDLLQRLFDVVVVPETVFHEATWPDKKEAQTLKRFLQGKVRNVDLQDYVFLMRLPMWAKRRQWYCISKYQPTNC